MMGKKKVAKKRGGGSMVKKKAKGGGINQHKRMAMGLKDGGPVGKIQPKGVGAKHCTLVKTLACNAGCVKIHLSPMCS